MLIAAGIAGLTAVRREFHYLLTIQLRLCDLIEWRPQKFEFENSRWYFLRIQPCTFWSLQVI